ncbi:MAG: hypothetical protein ACAH80_17700 [Alphaproteobacteria bacterium]
MGFFIYIVYLATSAAMILWVGRTLHTHGQVFLLRNFKGNEVLAGAISHLMLAGFYLITFGLILVTLTWGHAPRTLDQGFEFLCIRQGSVILMLGIVHFIALQMLIDCQDLQVRADEKWADGVKA